MAMLSGLPYKCEDLSLNAQNPRQDRRSNIYHYICFGRSGMGGRRTPKAQRPVRLVDAMMNNNDTL